MDRSNEMAARNERFVEQCLKQINTAANAEEGLHRLLQYLGEILQCDRVYVFEEMDRQHIQNTYEWCKPGISSGIQQLPYLSKKDLLPWYQDLTNGRNIIEQNVDSLKEKNQLIYEILKQQQIQSIVLSPLLVQGNMVGLLGADNPPPENMEHISVLFTLLAYFVSSLVNQRELAKLREAKMALHKAQQPKKQIGKTILIVDDSRELLRLNERVLRPQGYHIITAETLKATRKILSESKPDAIILDIDLPDGNGIDFCRELEGNIPIVFLTARSDEKVAKEGLQAGGCAFLTKPYQLEELQEAVARAVKSNSE